MSGTSVVKRYACALFESGSETGTIKEIRADIKFIDSLMTETPEIRNFCLTSHTNRYKEKVFIKNAFLPYVSPPTGRMLEIMCDNGRIAAIPFLAEAFSEQEDRISGIVPLLIESVYELSADTLVEIEDRMHRRTGRKVRSEVKINPSLIGGIRLTWENRTIDLSLNGRLKKLKTLLKYTPGTRG